MTTYSGTFEREVFAPNGVIEDHLVIRPFDTPDATPDVVKVVTGEYSDDRGVTRLPLRKVADESLKAIEKAGYHLEFDRDTIWTPSYCSPEQAAVLTTPVVLTKEN